MWPFKVCCIPAVFLSLSTFKIVAVMIIDVIDNVKKYVHERCNSFISATKRLAKGGMALPTLVTS